MVNGKLRKLWAYFASSDQVVKASGPEQRQQQRLAEGDVEARERQDDEAARGHPMDEALEGVEAYDLAARPPVLDLDHAARQIKQHQ